MLPKNVWNLKRMYGQDSFSEIMQVNGVQTNIGQKNKVIQVFNNMRVIK